MNEASRIDCAHVIRELWDYLDGELNESRWKEIRDHLAICTGCASHVEFCRSFLAQVASARLETEEVARVRARVLELPRVASKDTKPSIQSRTR